MITNFSSSSNKFEVGVFLLTQDYYLTSVLQHEIMIIARKSESRFVNDIYNGYNVLNGFSLDQMFWQPFEDNRIEQSFLQVRNITNNLSATATMAAEGNNFNTPYSNQDGFATPRELWDTFWPLYKNTRFNNDVGSNQYVFYCYLAGNGIPHITQAPQIP